MGRNIAIDDLSPTLIALSPQITNAFMEGLNSVFSAVKRRSRGFRSMEYLTTMLYFVAGKLRLPAI